MENGWKLVIFLSLAAVAGVLLRRRFLGEEAPLRRWYETRVAPLGGKLFTAFCFVTLAAWVVLWAAADPEERTRLPREFQKVLKSMEWGRDETTPDAPQPEANPAAPEAKP